MLHIQGNQKRYHKNGNHIAKNDQSNEVTVQQVSLVTEQHNNGPSEQNCC